MSLEFDFPKNKSELITAFITDIETEMEIVVRSAPVKAEMIASVHAWLHIIKEIKHIIND
jgi:hypothetical protein